MSEAVEKTFLINKIYTQNVSFESPNAPAIFAQEYQPQIDMNLNMESGKLEEGIFHSVLRLTVTVKAGEQTAFLCEVEQAGIFTLQGFEDEELRYMIGSQCPTVLFPYARQAISDLVSRGGFAPLWVEPVSFDALYANHLEQQKAQAAQISQPEIG